MSVLHRVENHNGSEVLIVKVARFFDSSDLIERLMLGARRSYQRGSTFKVVVDYDYTLRHIASTGFLYDELKCLTEIPNDGFQYRVSIVVDNDPTILNAVSSGLFDRVESISDFIGRVIRGGFLAIDVLTQQELYESNPIMKNSWIRIHTNLSDGIEWCVNDSPWR